MTGLSAFQTALSLLGYTDATGDPDSLRAAEAYKEGLTAVRQITDELVTAQTGHTLPPVASLRQELPLDDYAARQVLPYGIAWMLAAARGDGDNQALYAALYDRKRTAVSKRHERIIDVLGRGCDA